MENNNSKEDQAFERMLRVAYGIPSDRVEAPLKSRLPRWVKMSRLDIGKEMYGTIHTPDMRAIRDAYVRGLLHGEELQKYKQEQSEG